MRFRDPKRLRIVSSITVLLLLTGMPALVGLTRLFPSTTDDPPSLLSTYAAGLSSLALVGMAATILAIFFGFWLFVAQRREVGRKYLQVRSRRRRNVVEDARTLAIILGSAGLIVGSLAGLYAAMIHARPEFTDRLALPFLTPGLAIGCLLGGGMLYAVGRLGR